MKKSKTSANNSIGGNGGNKHSTGLPSLSVQIVQQISAHCQQDTPQTIHTNVTVSSCFDTDSPNAGGTSHSVHTSVQCKQEPSEDSVRSSAANPSSSTTTLNANIDSASVGNIGIGLDGLDEYFESIEKNGLEGAEKEETRNGLNEFDEILKKILRDSQGSESGNMYAPLARSSPGLLKGNFPNLGSTGHMGSIFDNNQSMNASVMTNHTIPLPTAIAEPTGPCAETLKQMAAQHQNQNSPGYPMKGMDHFTDGLHNGGFSPNYNQLYHSVPNMASSFPFNHSTNHHMSDSSQMTPEMAAAMTYGGTKPLTHFPNEQRQQHSSPSSLQQLQNQVQSHFKPNLAAPHQMQITQTQHMQLSHGSHSMQMSQTQQVQMQPSPQQISLTQQQNFSMGQQQMVSEQMKIQMMEKLRMEQQQQQAQHGCMPAQYMGRPPPDYKMHHNARPQGPYTNTMNVNGNQNPLQTMQNMVNKTSYGTVKNEVASASSPVQTNGGMMSSQISAMQQQTMSVTMASNGSHLANLPQASQGVKPTFHTQQHMQQPPAYSAVESSARAPSSSTYTSAIMRNQRPPNVNVGPEGLNISQPRTNTEWGRANLMQPGHVGMRSGMPSNGQSPHGISQSAAMSAAHMMQYQQHRPPHYGATSNTGCMPAATSNMAQMQQQVRQALPGQVRGGPISGLVPNGSQMMVQHQSMQMSVHTSNSAYNMGGPTPGTPSLPTAGYSMGGPSPGATLHSGGVSNSQTNGAQSATFSSQQATPSSQDELFHFLDNPLTNEPMFDSIQSTADDFSMFEDFLNGK